jgi:hypothetical protein
MEAVALRKRGSMSSTGGGKVTGTADKDYNIVWFTEQSLSNALRQAGDTELAKFFRRAQDASRRGGEQGKKLLATRIGKSAPGSTPPTALGVPRSKLPGMNTEMQSAPMGTSPLSRWKPKRDRGSRWATTAG